MRELQNVCVFLGSSTGTNPDNAAATVELGRELVARDMGLVYGGGAVGLMGLLADTVLKAGGRAIGIIPRSLFAREVAHQGLTELVETENMHDRKAMMYERSDAFIALPGGIGTLDELAEITTWRQIGLHDKPIGVVDVNGYYRSLLAWLDRVTEDGLLNEQNRGLVNSAPTGAELLDILSADPTGAATKWDN
ncbi:MAG: TIGR00730 family Rossman fold protein [Acidimicrobiales bacterium]|nr:TIGR00730 family Rossman fold protein [Acidimicrobiales bacterium]RZV46694.1 MAG: TIGR00730 family Rossman fold protein [Acidimicrobiales bacterium]